ncbi:hypothetical protein [Methylocapsa acidiphila]|uniref:hypothetical protein n=1 Tax=Methylocapsa acidiphila TaxID=133552 RepID=UPI00041EBE99|nr:hypothetical protein [Methylocapsa acidiphila]
MAALNLPAIERTLLRLQQAFPQINSGLLDRRDPLDDNVLGNLLEGYAMVDRLVCKGVDIFQMGRLHHWLELNAVVLCGSDQNVRRDHQGLIEATDQRFYAQPDGGIRDIVTWYELNRRKSSWRRAAGVYIRILSTPQLFIEGNHRTGALIMSYILAREGRPPFVLTDKNAREYFNPSSVFKKTNKRNIMMRLKLPGLAGAFAEYLKHQANKGFLLSQKSAAATNAYEDSDMVIDPIDEL